MVVPAAWSDVEFPSRALRNDDWRRLFDLAGYTVEGVPVAAQRRRCVTIAARLFCLGRGQVWTADVDPVRLLARISEQRAGESEHVVDARGLLILADSHRTGEVIG